MNTIKNLIQVVLAVVLGTLLLWAVVLGISIVAIALAPIFLIGQAGEIFNNKQKGK